MDPELKLKVLLNPIWHMKSINAKMNFYTPHIMVTKKHPCFDASFRNAVVVVVVDVVVVGVVAIFLCVRPLLLVCRPFTF